MTAKRVDGRIDELTEHQLKAWRRLLLTVAWLRLFELRQSKAVPRVHHFGE